MRGYAATFRQWFYGSVAAGAARRVEDPTGLKTGNRCALRPSQRCAQPLRGGASTIRNVALMVSGCLQTSLPFREVSPGCLGIRSVVLIAFGALGLHRVG